MTTTETFKIETQHIENYDVDGVSAEGTWKFKFGYTFRVTVPMSERSKQNAMAAVQLELAKESNELGVSYIYGAERVETDCVPSDDDESGDEEYHKFMDECLQIRVVGVAEQPLIFGGEDCDVDCVECQA